MNFQRAPLSIVRSIRQISLARDWLQLRRGHALPNIGDYVPDARSDDAAETLICEVQGADANPRYRCFQAGRRVEKANDAPLQGHFLEQSLAPGTVATAAPVWDACIAAKLPVYSIVAAADRHGCPVTIEQLYLPYSADHLHATFMLGSFHAFSTEGRFCTEALWRQPTKARRQFAVVIDPGLIAPDAKREPAEVVDV